jgi:hypothetical protein
MYRNGGNGNMLDVRSTMYDGVGKYEVRSTKYEGVRRMEGESFKCTGTGEMGIC